MNLSAPFIARPVATTLLTFGVLLAGGMAFTKLPVAVGFGISNAQQFAQVGEFADAAVVGSAIVQAIERNPGREAQAVAQFITELKRGVR